MQRLGPLLRTIAAGAAAVKRVAIGGLHTECSSYSPVYQTQADFTRMEGATLIDTVPFDFKAHDLLPVPLFHDRSVPGGPVTAETFASQRADFMNALRAALPLDGVLLLMHGAMFVPGTDDPEGEFIAQVREVVGDEVIICAAFDLHGQVTQRIVDTLDAFAAYRTAPHIDVAETHARAATLLAQALNGGARPVVCWQAIPILVSGEMSSTFVAPCDALYAGLPALDAVDGVEDSNLMIGYIWADSPRATAAAVVTATDRVAGEKVALEIASRYKAARDQLIFDMEATPLEKAIDTVKHKTAILADSGDNPTAGGVGDRADVLAVIQARGLERVLFAGIADPAAYDAAASGALAVKVGGSIGGGGPRVNLPVDGYQIMGDIAMIKSRGVTILITRLRRPFHHFTDFEALGLDLKKFDLIVVKSGYLSPDLRTLPRCQIMALTEGAVCQDFATLSNNYRPQGTWPFT